MAFRLHETLFTRLLLFFAVAFNLYKLYPEVAIRVPMLNDGVLHLLALQRAVAALAAGQDPTDPWLAPIDLGYPLFHYYQHLPYVLPALVYLPLRGIIPLGDFFHWISYLLLSLFPLSIYCSMRRFRFSRLAAAFAGLLAPLLATNGLYGLELGSYVWGGYGMYTQLWGMILLPPALAQCYAALRTGRGYFWAVLLLAATVLSHVVLGYIALASVVLFALLPVLGRLSKAIARNEMWRRGKRLALLLALVVLAAAYFLVPFLLDGAYLNRSVWELPSKYDSYGYQWVLGTLAGGGLFDYGRFPALTILAGAGLAVCLWRWRRERYRVPAILAMTWLMLYFGRPTWGVLLNLLPMSHDLQLHRLIAGVHLGGIYLMGIGLALPWRWAASRRDLRYLLAAAGLTVLLLYPVYQERASYLAQNTRWLTDSRRAYVAEEKDVTALVAWLRHAPPGRVYAGYAGNWGKDFRLGAVPVYALLQSAGLDMVGYLYHALSLNADVEALFDERRPEQYNLFNVRYVVAPQGRAFPAFVRPVKDFGPFRLYEVATTGYFDLVGAGPTFVGGKQDFYPAASRWLESDKPRVKEYPTLILSGARIDYRRSFPLSQAGALIPWTTLSAQPSSGRVVAETVESDAYGVEVQVARASTLVLKETYHPDWHATVDGRTAGTEMVMPSYVGVPVAPGTHHVLLEYRPSPLRGLLMIVGLLTLALLAIKEWWPDWLARRTGQLSLQRVATWPEHVRLTVPSWRSVLWAPSAARAVRAPFGPPAERAVPPRKPMAVGVRTKIGIYLLFLSIYLVSAAGHFFSTDHIATYLTAQSLVERHSLAIKPINDTARGRDGQYYGAFGLGQSLAVIPFYLTGKLVDSVSPPAVKSYFGGVNLGDWGRTVPIFFVSLLNQFVTPLICVLVFLFCVRLGFSVMTSFATTLIFGFSTAAWVYARDSFQHPLESLLLLLCVYILFSNQADLRPRHALLAGMALAFGILTRINLLVVAPAIAIYLFYIAYQRVVSDAGFEQRIERSRAHQLLRIVAPALKERPFAGVSQVALQSLLVFAAPIILVLGVIMYLNNLKFGTVLTFEAPAQARGFSTPLWLGLYGNLFSVGRSIFLYSPPTLLALYAFRPFYRKHRAEALLFLAISAIYLFVYSTYGFWPGGWAWGPRFLVATIPFLIIPVGYVVGSRRRMAIVALLACLGIGVQILGVALNYDFVYWDWIYMRLSPANAFLFAPDISPIPTHLRDLLQGRHVDLWLLEVYQQFGFGLFLATLAVPLLSLAGALILLRNVLPGGLGALAAWWAGLERRSLLAGTPWPTRVALALLLLAAVSWTLVRDVAYVRTIPTADMFAYECYARGFWRGPAAVVDVPYTRFCGDPAYGWWLRAPRAYHTFPNEYPAPALTVFSLPLLMPFVPYYLAFMVLMAGLALAVTAYLARCRLLLCAGAFALYVLLGGWGTVLARFDLAPGVLTLVALILAERRRWRLAYLVLAAAALLKVYPVILLPILAVHEWRRTGRYPCRGPTLFALAILAGLLPFTLLDPRSLLQPLTYEVLRPPEIESLPASLLWLSGRGGAHVDVVMAYQALGLTSAQAGRVVGVATALLIAGVMVICWRAWRGHDSLGRSFVLGVLVTLCGTKVLSPQYVLWLFPLAAYVEGVRLRWALLALLTAIIYPWAWFDHASNLYTHMLSLPNQPFFMGTLLARNAMLLTLTLAYLAAPAGSVWGRRARHTLTTWTTLLSVGLDGRSRAR